MWNRRARFVAAVIAIALWVRVPLPAQTKRATPELDSLPFVGCGTGGQAKAFPPPKQAAMRPSVGPRDPASKTSAQTLAQLAYYESASGLGVVAPKGWQCYAEYGSGGDQLYVSPAIPSSGLRAGFSGPVVIVSHVYGFGSGATVVAPAVARLFPDFRGYAQNYYAANDQAPAYGPFPGDTLTRQSSTVVKYITPAQQDGEGTLSGVKPNGEAISGVVVLDLKTFDMVHLAVRMPPKLRNLASAIVQQVEQDAPRILGR